MATRTGDANLITGAGKAYKNYDNVAGMYSGLDKIVKKGGEIYKGAIKDYDKKILEQEVLAKQEETKKDAIDQNWESASDKVLGNAGSFETQKDYNYTFDKISGQIKQDFIAAQGPPVDKKALAAATNALSTEKKYIDDMVALRADLAKPDNISLAMNHNGQISGNDGRQKSVLAAFLAEEYDIVDINGERYYSGVDSNGEKWEMTKQQIEDTYVLKVTANVNSYNDVYAKYAGKSNLMEKTVKDSVIASIPDNVKGLRAFVSDDHFEGKNFRSLLDNDKNLETEVMQAFEDPDNAMFDLDNSGTIDADEFARMKDAIIDPYNDVWFDQTTGKHDKNKWNKFTRQIVIDKLTNGIMNAKPEQEKSNQEYYDQID
jgi:hypothetical protein